MKFQPGRAKTGGRKPGVQNKTTIAVRDALIGAFENAGGEQWLTELARDDPKTFATLVAKLIPTESKLSADVPIVAIRNYTGREFEDGGNA